MSDQWVTPIHSVRPPEPGGQPKVSFFEKSESLMAREHTLVNSDKSVNTMDNNKDLTSNLSNISIHFDVDKETNRLIVFVIERESGRIIRTIPASEMDKMRAGELLKLKA